MSMRVGRDCFRVIMLGCCDMMGDEGRVSMLFLIRVGLGLTALDVPGICGILSDSSHLPLSSYLSLFRMPLQIPD